MSEKKQSRRKYIIAAVILLLIITFALVLNWFNKEQKPDPVSESIIRAEAAVQLNKDPNKLTDEDFARITELRLDRVELVEIELLKKFMNLQLLQLSQINYPANEIPKWMSLMAKLGIFDIDKRFALDLSPLEKLHNLEMLSLSCTTINNFKPISGLVNLNYLDLNFTTFSDLKPIRNLKNLYFLNINSSQVSDLKPIMEFKNCRTLFIQGCPNITDSQVEDLQKALPELEILR